MNDHDPQLGGKSPRRDPMISSVNTRARAQAEGLYRTGNLDGLLRRLSAQEQAQWRQAVVRQALSFAEPLLSTPDLQPLIALVHQWLADPSDAGTSALVEHAFQAGILTPIRGLDFEPAGVAQRVQAAMPTTLEAHKAHQLLLTIVDDSLYDVSSAASTLAMTSVPFTEDVEALQAEAGGLSAAARRWQLDAAWAILNARPVPPLEGFITDDAQGEYRSGRLDRLIARMSLDQEARFRQALMRQLLRRIPPPTALLEGPLRERFQAALAAAHRWLDDPSPAHVEALHAAVADAEALAPSRRPTGLAALRMLADLQGFARQEVQRSAAKVARQLARTLDADLVAAAQEIIALDVTLLQDDDLDDEQFDEDDYEPQPTDLPAEPTLHEREQWQLDAAWAILHDQDIPG